MQSAEAPGVIPAWKSKLASMSGKERQKLAVTLGVSDRTLANWASGKTSPKAWAVTRIARAR